MTKSGINDVFGNYSEFYDLVYNNKDYPGEAEYIESLLVEHQLHAATILDFGSGTGKHGRLLAAMGHSVTGVELSKRMVDLAEQSERFQCVQGDVTKINLNSIYDCVISLFHVVSYLTANNQVEDLFRNVNRHLRPGGIFIFDCWYSPSVNFKQPEVRMKTVSDHIFDVIRIAQPTVLPNANRVDIDYFIFSKRKNEASWNLDTETHSMRHFSTPEVSHFAHRNGFSLLRVEEFKTRKPPSLDTWAVCYVLEKVGTDFSGPGR